ncbi:MAG: TIGR04141 family sporadically distributed protein [Candidatus Lokiarchaeota archaeon]|nr:TIGR04141 family sporadically distributed protein [Candidatus Lokiarchaeota archaeon]
MIRINAYLLKKDFTPIFRYTIVTDTISENKNSIFDQNVCLIGEQRIIERIKFLKHEPKVIIKASSQYEVYYRNKSEYDPDWKLFWQIDDNIKQRTADAIILLKIDDRILAICHGHSSSLLNPYAIESYFGLRTAINMLDPKTINSADMFTPASSPFQTRKKSGAGADFNDFEINTLTTLLKNISGKVKKEYEELIKSIDGADSLSFSFCETPEALIKTISEFLTIYNLDTYKRTVFKYIDNFSPIKDKEKIIFLNEELLKNINGRSESVRINIPVDIHFTSPINFKFGGLGSRTNVFDNIDIKDTLYSVLNATKKTFNNIDELLKPILHIIDYNDPSIEKDKYPLYKCLYFEVKENEIWYFIESGTWYEVKKSFSDKIDADIDLLIANCLSYDIKFSKKELFNKYNSRTSKKKRYEYWFNQELVALLNKNGCAQCLDSDDIQLTGYDKIEVCDVLYSTSDRIKYLFHNKYKYGSSSLSHLFSQGNVSAELLTNPDFREKVNSKIDNDRLKYKINDAFDPRNNIIVFGIITTKERDGSFSIPLFSKINLKIFLDSLRSKSYNVKLCFFEEV